MTIPDKRTRGTALSRSRCSLIALFLPFLSLAAGAQTIGDHKAVYDVHGTLRSWTSWSDAIDREMNWYLNSPFENGYPRFAVMTFMDGSYSAVVKRPDFIPAMQNGMGIISYLKYYEYRGRKDARVLQFAKSMGDYLVKEANTPDTGKYPHFTRSTGWRLKFPQPADCGSQADKPYEVQPDKGAIAAYALVLLFEETKEKQYLDQALHNGRVLVSNMGPGSAEQSPWPFRVDYRTGEGRGPVSSNMSYILRLFDKLIAHGYGEFQVPRDRLWAWIRDYQIPDLKKDAALWVQFFEDYDLPTNRNAWSPLSLARYLVEKKEAIDPEWRGHSKDLIDFVVKRFTSIRLGVPVCGEQDGDKDPWGGILSSYGAVLALYTQATGDEQYKGLAHQALTIGLYATDEDGCPREKFLKNGRGGWQEDAHTDKIHNYIDAMTAFPEWAK